MKKVAGLYILLFIVHGCQIKSGNESRALAFSKNPMIASTNESFLSLASDSMLSQEDLERLEQHYPKTLERLQIYHSLTSQDIINMTKAGVADTVIIHEIQRTRSQFFLTPDEEQRLQQAGVSHKVIQTMKNTVDEY